MGSFATWQRELASDASQQRYQIATASSYPSVQELPPPFCSQPFPLLQGLTKANRNPCLRKCKMPCSRSSWAPRACAAVEQGNSPCFLWAPGQQQSSSQRCCWAALPTKSSWEKTLWWAQEPREIQFCLAPKSDLFSQTLSQQSAHSMYFTKRFLSKYDRNEKKKKLLNMDRVLNNHQIPVHPQRKRRKFHVCLQQAEGTI